MKRYLSMSLTGMFLIIAATAIVATPAHGGLLVGNDDPANLLPGNVLRFDVTTGAPSPSIDPATGMPRPGAVFVPAGSGGIGGGAAGALSFPKYLLLRGDGLYVSNTLAEPPVTVMRFQGPRGAAPGTPAPSTIGGAVRPGAFFTNNLAQINVGSPAGLAAGTGNDLFVATFFNIQRFNGVSGKLKGVFVANGAGGLTRPESIVFRRNLFVADAGSNAILRFDGKTGAPLPAAGPPGSAVFSPIPAPPPGSDIRDLTFGRDSNGDGRPDIYVSDFGTDLILRFDGATGAPLPSTDPATGLPRAGAIFVPAGSGGLNGPWGITFGADASVPADGFKELYVSSRLSGEILRYDGVTGVPFPAAGQPGAVFIPAGTGGLGRPTDLVVDGCPPDPPSKILRFIGKGHGLGRGERAAGLGIRTRFASDQEIDLSSATITVCAILDEAGEELVRDAVPNELPSNRNCSRTSCIYQDARRPSTRLKLHTRAKGVFDAHLDVGKATISLPVQCPSAELMTQFLIDDLVNPPLEVATVQTWRCIGKGKVNTSLSDIAPGAPTVTFPNDPGIKVLRGDNLTITWDGFTDSNVKVQLWRGDPPTKYLRRVTEGSYIANTGSLVWTVPDFLKPRSDYHIKVKGLSTSKSDFSDNPFEIE